MLVSIIIPTRNRWPLLRKAIQSAVRQTWADVEIVVVDDASNDETPTQIGRHFPAIKVMRHETAMGPSAARNRGVSASCGSAILFLDDDDLLHPDHVRALVDASRRLPTDSAVSGRWRKFEESDGVVQFGPVMSCPEGADDDAILEQLLEPLGDGTVWTSSVLWPRRLFAAVQWDEELFTNGDVDFFGRAILAGYPIRGAPVGMAYYRMHSGERVAGTFSERALVSGTRYRIKWTDLLAGYPNRERFNIAMQNAFMSLMIAWGQSDEFVQRRPDLEPYFRAWGGRRHYVPVPPRNPLKRLAAVAALKAGGPSALGWLMRLNRGRQVPRGNHVAIHPADADDAGIVASFQ
jgi:glycosyltransferase involved in cell wall biosynthesis